MKATLTFQLPEERSEFNLASKSGSWYCALWDLDQWLRREIKYAPDDANEDRLAALQEAREKLYAVMCDQGVSFDEVE